MPTWAMTILAAHPHWARRGSLGNSLLILAQTMQPFCADLRSKLGIPAHDKRNKHVYPPGADLMLLHSLFRSMQTLLSWQSDITRHRRQATIITRSRDILGRLTKGISRSLLSWYQWEMLVYGLTGGIASGKSSVSRHLKKLGADVVDADALAREVVVPGSPALREIARHFGPQFIRSDGQLDRTALGTLIFGDSDARRALNQILHPRIGEASQATLQTLRSQGSPVAIYEAPLLVENGLHKSMNGLIVVSLPKEIQLARLRSRDGIDESAAKQRIESQLPLSEKLALADYVIDNSKSLSDTQKQVTALWELLNTVGVTQ